MTSNTFTISSKVEKIVTETVGKQLLVNPSEVHTEFENHFDRGWQRIEGEALQSEFLQLNTKDVCSIIEGRVLALLKSFYYCHEFTVIAHFNVYQQLGIVQIDIHMNALI